ncbi:hypothetical protein M885DRAFT_616446 [Pelagophyceae sp. CCMP2097]|nr:hypothetical protein M885DRAFT_616446 [Pelagophyceae sp. CCMP2097]
MDDLAAKCDALTRRLDARASAAKAKGFAQWNAADDQAYFATKQQMLLAYCQYLAYYALVKAKGETVGDHAVLKRLFELRLVTEKMRLMESKLRHQLDQVLQRKEDEEAPARPNAGAMEAPSKGDEEEEELYVAPKHGKQKFDKNDDDDEEDDEDEPISKMSAVKAGRVRIQRERKTRARRSEMMRLVAEADSRPETKASDGAGSAGPTGGQRGAKRERLQKDQKVRQRFEEDRMMRVDVNQKQKKKRKANDQFGSSLDDVI